MEESRNVKRYNAIGKSISELRKSRNITQQQLADAVGISKSYLSKIEAQHTYKSFSMDVIFDIADTLEVDIKALFKYVE